MPIQIGQRLDHGFQEPLGLLSDCHRRIEHFLRVLVAIDRQAAGGTLTPLQRDELEAALTYFAVAGPRHTADEEESLFPRLRQTAHAAAKHAVELVERLERDHADASAHHAGIETLVRRWLRDDRLDPDAARALREHLGALTMIYGGHIAVEDEQVFPAAAIVLSASQLVEIGGEMAARRSSPGRMARPAPEGGHDDGRRDDEPGLAR